MVRKPPEAVLAIPGMTQSGDFKGQRLPDWQVLWDDQKLALHRWAAEHATRFLAAPIAVGTVDQAMLGALQVKHAHLRGSALSRSLLVVDEVHASDSYMTEILLQLTNEHLAVGGYAMLMSATLGATARVRWTGDVLPDNTAATATPYPAVWVAGETGPRTVAETTRSKKVHVKTADTMAPQHTAELAVDAARRGARVLVIRNTVAKAIETWEAVQEAKEAPLLMQAAGGPALHHSRFAVEDRVLLDEAAEAALAKDRTENDAGCIVIGTQTLEQSLDIDADMLISDLCPIDVLLQRIGRLHRHQLARPPGFERATAVVLLPERRTEQACHSTFLQRPRRMARRRTLRRHLSRFGGLGVDAGLDHREERVAHTRNKRALVEGATHPELIEHVLATKGERWQQYDQQLGGTEAAARMVAELNKLDAAHRSTPACDFRSPTNTS